MPHMATQTPFESLENPQCAANRGRSDQIAGKDVAIGILLGVEQLQWGFGDRLAEVLQEVGGHGFAWVDFIYKLEGCGNTHFGFSE